LAAQVVAAAVALAAVLRMYQVQQLLVAAPVAAGEVAPAVMQVLAELVTVTAILLIQVLMDQVVVAVVEGIKHFPTTAAAAAQAYTGKEVMVYIPVVVDPAAALLVRVEPLLFLGYMVVVAFTVEQIKEQMEQSVSYGDQVDRFRQLIQQMFLTLIAKQLKLVPLTYMRHCLMKLV
jgi:hypothetical protein